MNLEIWLSIVAIGILLIISAFLAASETALTAASKARLHALALEREIGPFQVGFPE